jgi:hypothetical protein
MMRSRFELLLAAAALSACSSASVSSAPPADAGVTHPADAAPSIGVDATVAAAGLVDLQVAPLTLTPAFSPDIHDYYVRCAAGANALTVAMTPKPGNQVAITAPASAASSGQQQVSLSVTENQAVVATATAGAASVEYWIRCLPADFPRLTLQTFPDAGAPSPGYYLLGDTFHAKPEGGYAIVLDSQGVPVWYHTTLNGAGADNVDVAAKNTISYIGDVKYTFSDFNSAYEVHNLATNAMQTVMPTGYPADMHELRRLSNGNYLMFSRQIETGVDLVGLSNDTASDNMVDCKIHEVDTSGNIVWMWDATDHLDPVKDCTYPVKDSAVDSSGTTVPVPDPFHCNSIDVAANGDLLVSSRNTDSIFLISRATGKIVWKLGGSSYTKDGAAYIAIQGDALNGFYRQHDARFLPDGTISVFDDETAKLGPARALVLSYDVDAGTAAIVWQLRTNAPSAAMGSVRTQGDGSRIIGWGLSGGLNPVFTEVGADGKPIAQLTMSPGDSSYRAIKVSTDDLDIELLRTTAGLAE